MDPVIITSAFVLGLVVMRIGLPPMVGFLVAGFALNGLGFDAPEGLKEWGDLGVTLLLFSIGLKLKINQLAKPAIWAGSSIHLLISVLLFVPLLLLLGSTGLFELTTAQWPALLLIAFALGFSSTVFAVKVLEDKGEAGSLYGRIAIGILVMQDIFAVIFLTVSTGKVPSLWAFGLLLLPFLRPALYRLLDRAGHGEMLVLYGLMLALLLGAALFDAVGLKPDLGALLIGMLLANHPKANELSKSLFSFKELFLVFFFFNIGLSATPTWHSLIIAALLCLLLPLKQLLFFWLMTRFRLRARTSLLTSLSLTNYSEFGLIVAAIGVSSGWIDQEWLLILALALSISFFISSPLNMRAGQLYGRLSARLARFQRSHLAEEDRAINTRNVRFIVFGMGRIGSGVYDELRALYGETVLGIETDPYTVQRHRDEGRNVVQGDATDSDFWAKLCHRWSERVFLAMPSHQGNLYAAQQLQQKRYRGRVAAIVHHEDEKAPLLALGVESVYNLYHEAGAGFAEHALGQRLQRASNLDGA